MKQLVFNFLIRFLLFFAAIIVWGKVYEPSNVNFDGVIRALVIAFGSALSWTISEYILNRRSKR
ncbi:hypothetical protein C8J48_1895 [Desmospora activa DSM 45169]|uniref:Uncharacterized protein n=1 Tax=Desmospora activa DSM 45169 TaxID=1121389 RepID=A0A2T4ZBM2_9BACL|nr:hypothetical protein C8J48_1895 [Desmospora activa DSM 45169]